MAVKSRNILKTFFETGDFPTEEEFGDFHDSYWHKTDDLIPISKIEGLLEALNFALDSVVMLTHDIQASYDFENNALVLGIWLECTGDAVIQIFDEYDVQAGVPKGITITKPAWVSGETITVTKLSGTGTFTAKIIKRNV